MTDSEPLFRQRNCVEWRAGPCSGVAQFLLQVFDERHLAGILGVMMLAMTCG